jgi:hypothetical protein
LGHPRNACVAPARKLVTEVARKIMDPNVLRDQLMKLHEELSLVKQVDPRSKQLLGEIMEEIKRLMEQSAVASIPAVAPPPSLSDRLEKVAVQFEADHPTLAASSRRLVDLLGKVGL